MSNAFMPVSSIYGLKTFFQCESIQSYDESVRIMDKWLNSIFPNSLNFWNNRQFFSMNQFSIELLPKCEGGSTKLMVKRLTISFGITDNLSI